MAHRIESHDDYVYVVDVETNETARAFSRTYAGAMRSAVDYLESIDGPVLTRETGAEETMNECDTCRRPYSGDGCECQDSNEQTTRVTMNGIKDTRKQRREIDVLQAHWSATSCKEDSMIHEVRNGEWVSREFRPGSILGLSNDERTLEQTRLDALAERAARALAAAHDTTADAEYRAANRAGHDAIIRTVDILLGESAAERLRETAHRLSLDPRART